MAMTPIRLFKSNFPIQLSRLIFYFRTNENGSDTSSALLIPSVATTLIRTQSQTDSGTFGISKEKLKKNEIKIIKFPDSFELQVSGSRNVDHNRLDMKKVEQVIDHMNEKMLEIGLSIREFYNIVINTVDTWNHWCLYEGAQELNFGIKMENRSPAEILMDVKRATALRRTYPK